MAIKAESVYGNGTVWKGGSWAENQQLPTATAEWVRGRWSKGVCEREAAAIVVMRERAGQSEREAHNSARASETTIYSKFEIQKGK